MSLFGFFNGNNAQEFISISSDNRVLVQPGLSLPPRVLTERQHLTHSYGAADLMKHLLVIGASDGLLLLFDLNKGVVAKSIQQTQPVRSLSCSADASSVFCASGERSVMCCDVQTGNMSTIKCGKKEILKVKCNPKANIIAVATR
jgi:WD40 repeat protein